MKPVYCIAGNIVNELGADPEVHWQNAIAGKSLLKKTEIDQHSHCFATYLSPDQWERLAQKHATNLTKSSLLCIESIENIIKYHPIDFNETSIIVASTKGDIHLLHGLKHKQQDDTYALWHLAKVLDDTFQPAKKTVVLSNACISGSQVLQLGASFLKQHDTTLKNVVVCGVDLVTPFVLKGFNSLKALSNEPCSPFDAGRTGISAGEAAASMVLSTAPLPFNHMETIQLTAGYVSNDANHISGPSRTGEGLFLALSAISQSPSGFPDAISLHGTATIFNDEMESIALSRHDMSNIPAFGLKGIYGHSMGASGTLESVISLYAMCHNMVPPTVNFTTQGTSQPVNVASDVRHQQINTVFKCSSGFGGGNCVLAFDKKSV